QVRAIVPGRLISPLTFFSWIQGGRLMYETNANAIAQNVFEQRCENYYKFLFRFALRKTGDKDQAEDIAQTTLMRFLGLMKKTKWDVEVTSVKAYLRKTAINVCNDIWRQRGKERT